MRNVLLAVAVIFAGIGLLRANDKPAESKDQKATQATSKDAPAIQAELKSDKQKSSYTLGYNMGVRIRRQFGLSAMDSTALLQGLQDAMSSRKPVLSRIESEEALARYKTELTAQQQKTHGALADLNKKRGETYLAQNKKKKGVVTLPSGIEYLVLKEGTGKRPKATDTVKVHYHGTLVDGTVFDSSVERGEPISFGLNGVIPGWTEVVQLMKVGSKWRVVIPSDLAYGPNGNGTIGPNETLIFEIELLKID